MAEAHLSLIEQPQGRASRRGLSAAHRIGAQVLRALDRPAQASVELADRSIMVSLGFFAAGLFGVALATLAADLLAAGAGWGAALQLDALRAYVEANAVVIPASLILASYLGVRVRPRALLAAAAIGHLAAAMTALCLVPTVAFLTLIAGGQLPRPAAPALLLPGLAGMAVAVFFVRAVEGLDPSPRARQVARGVVLLLGAAFAVRVLPGLQGLTGWRLP